MQKIIKIKNHFSKYFLEYTIIIFGVFFSVSGFCDTSVDPLAATVKPELQALFGPTSTVSYCIYLAEIVVGAVAYVKTKNLLVLIGVPILVIFTGAMFGYITPAG